MAYYHYNNLNRIVRVIQTFTEACKLCFYIENQTKNNGTGQSKFTFDGISFFFLSRHSKNLFLSLFVHKIIVCS